MFFGPELRQWLKTLDYQRTVEVVRALLHAEGSRLRVPLGEVTMQAATTVPDGGVDGRTDYPAEADTIFPRGPQTWQVKSGSDKPNFHDALIKRGVRADLEAGRAFVLAWVWDRTDKPALEADLQSECQRLYPGARAQLLLVGDIERMAQAHPTVVSKHGGPLFFGMGLQDWGAGLQVDRLPFSADGQRERYIAAIRAFATAEDGLTAIRVYGDTGVGKSRLVYEALKHPRFGRACRCRRRVVGARPRSYDGAGQVRGRYRCARRR